MYAARLAAALRARANVTIFGMGGDQMRAAGVEVIADYKEVSVLGITEILSHLPQLVRAMRRLVDTARERRPELAVLTDFPGFHLRLARKLRPFGVRNVYYICPQFWAWRPWRVRIVRRRFALALCIFPFEEEFFSDAGVAVKFIGHPLVGNVAPSETRKRFFAAHGLDPSLPTVAILPGSRASELARHLSVLRAACIKVQAGMPAQFVVAAAPGRQGILGEGWPAGLKVTVIEGQTYDVLAHSTASIVSSGTATLEAALLDVPMVVVYRVTPLTALLAKRHGESDCRAPSRAGADSSRLYSGEGGGRDPAAAAQPGRARGDAGGLGRGSAEARSPGCRRPRRRCYSSSAAQSARPAAHLRPVATLPDPLLSYRGSLVGAPEVF